MIYAQLNGQKIIAEPGIKANCSLCERVVFSKCGEIYIWHWAHLKGEGCDSWYEPETEWHKNWKLIFGKENSEIVIKKDNVKHIADVLTNEKIVIELQNSPIPKPIIRKRENFYGERMLWIINGIHFKDNFGIGSIVNSEFDNLYFLETDLGIVDTRTGELVREKSKVKLEVKFNWSRARRSWEDVQRPVFIDFGEEDLFWVKNGMGSSFGEGKRVLKTEFIRKYGGDISQIQTLIKARLIT